jgi:hypothetical protein
MSVIAGHQWQAGYLKLTLLTSAHLPAGCCCTLPPPAHLTLLPHTTSSSHIHHLLSKIEAPQRIQTSKLPKHKHHHRTAARHVARRCSDCLRKYHRTPCYGRRVYHSATFGKQAQQMKNNGPTTCQGVPGRWRPHECVCLLDATCRRLPLKPSACANGCRPWAYEST